ncbi:DUF1080 domain-containing protein, partial [bacterium]
MRDNEGMILALATLAIGKMNTLSSDERAAGWRLLFDGKTTRGWHNFKSPEVGAGWRIVEGALTCADPHTAGDLVTADRYDWFELRLEYRLAPGSNSGVLFHVADTGDATWQSGPEIQLHDSLTSNEPQKSGWLYGLYSTTTDAVRPEGEWNRLRLVVTPEGCSTELNDVPLVLFRLGSDDFAKRVAASKFGTMPEFAKLDRGALALQGDHGVV